jgi:hypothetical protein
VCSKETRWVPKSYKSEGNHDVGMFNCISHATSTYSIPHVTCLYNLTTSDLQVRTEMLDKYLMLMWYWHDNKAGQCLQVPGICGICGSCACGTGIPTMWDNAYRFLVCEGGVKINLHATWLALARTIYIRCIHALFLQGFLQIYGHIRRICTVPANPKHGWYYISLHKKCIVGFHLRKEV